MVEEKISRNVSRLVVNPACMAGVPDLESEFQRPVRPYEVVIAANQLEVIFEVLLPSVLMTCPYRHAGPKTRRMPFA
jgi:hypothetical protein